MFSLFLLSLFFSAVSLAYRPRDPFSHRVKLRAQIELHQEVLLWKQGDF